MHRLHVKPPPPPPKGARLFGGVVFCIIAEVPPVVRLIYRRTMKIDLASVLHNHDEDPGG